MSFSLLYVTHPSKPEAATLTAALLNERLIACANYYPTESVYWWEGRLTSSTEVMTIYKTRTDLCDQTEAYILDHHKYETPGVVRIDNVTANASYEAWIVAETLINSNNA